jgi:hypothetical protein
MVSLDFRKSKIFPFKLDERISGLVLLVLLVLWYFWFPGTSAFLVLLVSWYFCFSGTSGIGEN